MKVDVTTEIVIDRPVAEVSAYAADPDNAPSWYANIRSVAWETAPPVQQGSRVAFVARFLGRQLAYVYEVAELSPGKRLVMRTQEGPFPMETTYTWAAESSTSTRPTSRRSWSGHPPSPTRVGPRSGGVPRGGAHGVTSISPIAIRSALMA